MKDIKEFKKYIINKRENLKKLVIDGEIMPSKYYKEERIIDYEEEIGYEDILSDLICQEELSSQDIGQLSEVLVKIDDLIDESSGSILNHLLFRKKKVILDKIQELSSTEKIENLNELVGQLSEGDIKQKLLEELNSLQTGAEKYNQEIQDIAIQDITARETEAKIKLEQQRLDGLERKSKIWLSFLQRESAASIVGAIVLLLLTFSLIIGMFCGLESQIISNGFLVILGYFFGQSSSRNNKDNNAGGDV